MQPTSDKGTGSGAEGIGSPAAPPPLRMTDVSAGSLRNPEQALFEQVHWCVEAGAFWAIGGLHACGKTDFMALAAGLLRPIRGSYQVFGRELDPGFEPDLLETRRRLGLVFDGGRVLRHLTVAENVALPLCYHRGIPMDEAVMDIAPLLHLTGLAVWADQSATRLTRNWQQRVGLARALALAPDVLLLDSPLSGLDPRDAAWWLEFLTQLSAGHAEFGGRPMTLVVSCDDLRPWKGRARQFAVLRGRRFIPLPDGTHAQAADDLLQNLIGPLTA